MHNDNYDRIRHDGWNIKLANCKVNCTVNIISDTFSWNSRKNSSINKEIFIMINDIF